MDILFLRQLAVSAIIGLYPNEKEVPQTIFLDLELAIDVHQAAMTDEISSTIDYSVIYSYLREYIPITRFQLLETLAVNVSENLLKKFSLSWLRLTITKKPADMPDIAGAGITIERGLYCRTDLPQSIFKV